MHTTTHTHTLPYTLALTHTHTQVQWHPGVTRTCTTILEASGRMTEIIEPSDAIPAVNVLDPKKVIPYNNIYQQSAHTHT